MRAYALSRKHSLLIFPSAEARDTYARTHMKFDPPQPITAEDAERWQPASPDAKTVYFWREGGGWRTKGFFGKVLKQEPSTKEAI